MARMRVAIVDDEPMGREVVTRYLRNEAGVEIVGEAGDGAEAIALLRRERPDLVFLDVQMPGKNGFEVLDAVPARHLPAVVFVTAYEEYALQAFERGAVDYLLKPITRQRFMRAFAAARGRIERDGYEKLAEDTRLFLEALRRQERYLARLSIKTQGRVQIIPVHTVEAFESDGAYVQVHAGGRTLLWHGTLDSLQERLDPRRFIRIHRRAVVAIDQICELQRWFHHEYVVLLKSGRRIRTGRAYMPRLKGFLGV